MPVMVQLNKVEPDTKKILERIAIALESINEKMGKEAITSLQEEEDNDDD